MIDILKKAALAGGEVLKSHFGKKLRISFKGNIHDLVTEADKNAQKAIVQSIKLVSRGTRIENKIGFIGEEDLHTQGEYMFIMDPLDGTLNFASGIDYFCVSIGLIKDNKIIAGVVYEVMRDIFYLAEAGKGAFKNRQRIFLPENKRLREAVIFSSPSNKPKLRQKAFQVLETVSSSIRSFRTLGSVALEICKISEGVGELVLHGGCNIWDIAAAKLILEEAGGIMVDWNGQPLTISVANPQIYTLLAGEENLLKEFIGLVNKNAGHQSGGEGR